MPKGEMIQHRVRVDVTEADIAKAKRNDSSVCVVAQAIARTIKDAKLIEVDTQSIRYTAGMQRFIYPTPAAVQGYVIGFDAGDPTEPFSFWLRFARRITAKRRVPTAAGKAIRKVADKARGKASRLRPDGTPVTPESVKEAVSLAYSEAKKGFPPDTPALETLPGGERTAPKRVFRTKKRSYGHRVLRINQVPV